MSSVFLNDWRSARLSPYPYPYLGRDFEKQLVEARGLLFPLVLTIADHLWTGGGRQKRRTGSPPRPGELRGER